MTGKVLQFEVFPVDQWFAKAEEFGKAGDKFRAVCPRSNPATWSAWRNYFRWLKWSPYWFLEVERQHANDKASPASWTAPCDHPDDFRVDFKPKSGPAPEFPLESKNPPGNGVLTLEQRQAYIKRMRGSGHLSFGTGGRDRDRERGWFDRMSRQDAKDKLADCLQEASRGRGGVILGEDVPE